MNALPGTRAWLTELRTNSRLRLGAWLIAAIAAAYGILTVSDANRALSAKVKESSALLARLTAIAQQQEWPQRALAARELRQNLDNRLWQAGSKGLAQADFQTWVAEQSTQAGLQNTRLTVENTADVEPVETRLWRVTARLDGDFHQPAFDRWLLAIAQSPRFIEMERLEIQRIASGNKRFSLTVTAYFAASAETN